jgi:hypothetical protein
VGRDGRQLEIQIVIYIEMKAQSNNGIGVGTKPPATDEILTFG